MSKQQTSKITQVVISFGELTQHHNHVIIDTRTTREYNLEHIPESINLPLQKILEADTDMALCKVFGDAGISSDTLCIFYDGINGAVASRGAMALESVGGHATLLDQDFEAWKLDQNDVKTTTDSHTLPPTEFKLKKHKESLTKIDDVESASKDGSAILIDARPRLNFLSGHIPGAINMPSTMFRDMEKGKILRTPDELNRLFKNRDIITDKSIQIITYCGSAGTLSGLVYYALKHAGFTDIGMYSNSFREWKSDTLRDIKVQEDANYWDLSAE